MAPNKKNAQRLNAWLVFLDESGLLMAPLVRRSWAPRGRTPVLWQRGAHHQKVSALAALCVRAEPDWLRFYFRLHPQRDIRTEQVIGFLQHLHRELDGPWLLLWDRLNAHRARRTTRFLAPRLYPRPFFLPPYAPELNPVEYAWAYLKMNPLANRTCFDLLTLAQATRHHARRLQRQPSLLRSFLHHSPLF